MQMFSNMRLRNLKFPKSLSVEVFVNRCQRKINIPLPHRLSNKDLFNLTQENEINNHKWDWIGHILRQEMKTL